MAIPELNATAFLLAVFGILILASALLGRTVERFGIPTALLFLVLGILAGSEGLVGIGFDDYRFAFRVGTVALVLILFDGGLNTPLSFVKENIWPAAALATFGVILTAAMVVLVAKALSLSWTESLLLGAVVSSTDAAAVFAVLRGGQLRLIKRIGTTLELEAGLNDPMAVILTLAVIQGVMGSAPSAWGVFSGVVVQLVIGLGCGLTIGAAARALLLRIRLSTGGLYPVITLALAFFTFGVTTLVNGSGFLAVFAAGTVLGNSTIPYRTGLSKVHDTIAWFSQISMFLVLGLLVFPSQLGEIAGVGLGAALFLALVARPIAVAACLAPFHFSFAEVVYVGWVGLRGAVPIILGTFPVLAGVPGAMNVFNIAFFVVVVNAIIPGATIRFLTRRLKMAAPETPIPPAALEITSTRLLKGDLVSFYITSALAVCDATLSQIPFPVNASAILVVRGEQLLAARGHTKLGAGDHVYVFCQLEDRAFIELLFGRPQDSA